jgi:hypothetical protein
MIEERIQVIRKPGKELGLRFRIKVVKTGFSESLDTENIILETYNKEGNVENCIVIEKKLMPDLIKAAKAFTKKKKNVLVSARIVS